MKMTPAAKNNSLKALGITLFLLVGLFAALGIGMLVEIMDMLPFRAVLAWFVANALLLAGSVWAIAGLGSIDSQ